MKGTIYRLNNYKILELIDGTLWWESYAVFARTQSGRCFIESDILFLAPAIDISEPGFLIMEYNEALNILPQWTNTPYYCSNFIFRSCRNDNILPYESIGKGLKEESEEAAFATAREQNDLGPASKIGFDGGKDSVYRLGRYKIIESKSGDLRWHTCTHLNRLKFGHCFVQGKILFLGRKIINESEFSQREFFNCLKQLPKWSKTPYYCTNYTLKPCQTTTAFKGNKFGRYFRDISNLTPKKINLDKNGLHEKIYTTVSEIAAGIIKYKH